MDPFGLDLEETDCTCQK